MTLRIPSRPLPPPHTHMQAHAPYLSACSFLTLSPSLPPLPPPSLPPYTNTQSSDSKIRELLQRVEQTETRQNTMISFFTTALKNPTMLQRLFTQVGRGGKGEGEGEGVTKGLESRTRPCCSASSRR